jgi:uncharacterized repeat protein (TIGR01451 family)
MSLAVITSAALVAGLGQLPAAHAAGPDLAAGKAVTASSSVPGYAAANAVDGNQATYWESANNAFPQWIQVDLGTTATVDEVVLKVPTANWEARTQTLSVTGSTDGTTFTTLKSSAGYAFNPSANNTVTITLPATSTRHVRITVTANTAWPAAQLAEFEVHGISTPPTDPPPTTPPPTGDNLALNKPIAASTVTHTYVATNANDGNTTTYWEGAYPSTLTVQLGANAAVSAVVLKLNPDGAWGPRTQTVEILGRAQGATGLSTIKAAATYSFSPSSGNTVTIPVTATVTEVQLRFTANSGAPGGQVAEFQVIGTPAPNPDLTVTGVSAAPASPVETDAITLSATVRNAGNAASPATTVTFYLGTAKVGTATVGALAAGASSTVSASIGARAAGTYQLTAKVDESGTVVERDEANNSFTSPTSLTVRPVDTADLIAAAVTWSPGTPQAGDAVTFTVTVRNQGSVASSPGAHAVTVTVLDDAGAVVRTLTGSVNGVIAAGGNAAPLNLGTWTAGNGRYTVRVVIAADANEQQSRQGNNTSERSLFVGRGANMPYDMLEAEDGTVGGGATVVGPNRTVGDLAGEASGRRAVTLNQTGSSVEWTTRSSTNTLVTRFSIPDGTNTTLNIYVNGTYHKAIPLTSRFAWLYGPEAQPSNSPGAGPARHIYDEANIFLNSTVPAGSRIRLQKDAANNGPIAIDFINTEQVAPVANPDPARYAVPAGFTQQDVQNAVDRARMEANLVGVYLPAGDYQTSNKFHIFGKAVRIIGAGPWYTRFYAPQNQEDTDVGFRAEATANGSVFSGFAYFGNYVIRRDGPGKVFDFNRVSDITIDNVWAEHMVCLYWGSNTDNMTIRNSRIRNTFADGINMTNDSRNNLVSNIEARATGDDSFALFNATDAGGGDNTGNTYENLTSLLTWRAAGVAVYGGYGNTFRNIHIADTLVYSGITISSLDFGIPMNGFGANPPTTFDNISIVRAGGNFWGGQTFPAIWVFSASKVFQGIRVSNADIIDPTYSGIMFQTGYVGGQPQFPVKDIIFTNVSISGARRSGDAFDARSGFGIWVNEMPEPGQGPAVGSAVFNNLRLSNNAVDIRNTTSTFTITRNP